MPDQPDPHSLNLPPGFGDTDSNTPSSSSDDTPPTPSSNQDTDKSSKSDQYKNTSNPPTFSTSSYPPPPPPPPPASPTSSSSPASTSPADQSPTPPTPPSLSRDESSTPNRPSLIGSYPPPPDLKAKPEPVSSHLKPASTNELHPKPVSSIFILALAGIAILTIALSAFLYLQNNALKKQVNILQSTEAGRQLSPTDQESPPENDQTPETQPTESSTTEPVTLSSAFTNLAKVIDIAHQKYSTAQLLMITTDNLLTLEDNVYRYWFRQAPDTKSYFYIQYSQNEDPQLVINAIISPDNNIPDLIPLFEQNQLGVSDIDAHAIAWSKAISPTITNLTPSSVKAKFIRAIPSTANSTNTTNIWQLTYSFPQQANQKDIVVQIDSTTQEVLYSTL